RATLTVQLPPEITLPSSRVQAEVTYRKAPPGERPQLGLDTVPLTQQLADFLGVPVRRGLLISALQPRMPAALAGLLVGDVILSIDGLAFGDPQSFFSHVESRGWGSTVVLRYVRKSVERVTRVHLRAPRERDAAKR